MRAATTVATQTTAQPEQTYRQILKSSLLVGGSSAANIVIGVVRAKAMAILLGPAGVGLTGLYSSILDVSATIAGMGVNSSGVRQIAAAVGSGDTDVIARTTVVLRRVSILLGALGAAGLFAFSGAVSAFTFGNTKYSGAICLLSVAVFFKLISAGQSALIQGMRRISDLAKMAVWSALFGTVSTIIVVFFLREKGIVPSIVCGLAVSIFISWRYSRKIRIQKFLMPVSEAGKDVAGLLKLGAAFMMTSLMTIGSAYVIRIIIVRSVGFEGAGLYQSAWTLGGMYVGFILQAMGADFYPRLTSSIHDHATSNRLVNEQARVGLLLAGPGVIATLTIAPAVIAALYSAKFGAAVPILRWICLGATLQVITWPMGFIIVAKCKQNLFIFSELAWAVVSVALSWACIERFGLAGAGIAFFLSYVFHGLLVYPIVRHLSGFRWSRENLQTGGIFVSIIACVFCGLYVLPNLIALAIGVFATIFVTTYALRILMNEVEAEEMPRPILKLLAVLDSRIRRLSAVLK